MAVRDFIEALVPAFGAAASRAEMRVVLDNFRNDRANDIAALADRAGRSGVRLARMERERDAWIAYAKELEKACMAAGLPLPKAPDETASDPPPHRDPD